MTIEQKIKEIEGYYNQAQKLHKNIKSPFKGTFKPEFSASEKEGLDYLEFIMPAIGYVSYSLEVIRELQANPTIISDNSKVNADLLKENQTHKETILFLGKENNALKAQVNRVRDTEGLRKIIHSTVEMFDGEVLDIIKQQQNYILGGEGV